MNEISSLLFAGNLKHDRALNYAIVELAPSDRIPGRQSDMDRHRPFLHVPIVLRCGTFTFLKRLADDSPIRFVRP